MVQCTNGSGPKSGSPSFSTYDDAFVLAQFGSVAGWLTLWAMGLPTVPFYVPDFCSVEPVGDLPTAADWLKLAFPPIALLTGTYERFRNQLVQDKFAALCQCNAASGGACLYGYPSYPHVWANTPAAGACRWYTQEFTVPSTQTCYGMRGDRAAGDVTPFAMYLWDATNNPNNPIAGSGGIVSVTGDNLYLFSAPVTLVAGNVYVIGAQTNTYKFDNSLTRVNNANVTYGQTRVSTVCAQTTVPTSTDARSFQFEPIICTGGPPPGTPTPFVPPPAPAPPVGFPNPPAAPTCGSQQDICNMLNTINQKLDWQRTQVDVLQRRLVPFAWILGATQSVTGSGIIAVQDVLGCIVTLTTVPNTWGSTNETPRRLIPSTGSLQAVLAPNFDDLRQVHYEHEVFIFKTSWATGLRYNFRPGIVATITPILPEP
jgi:hypothetical protein